MGARRSFDDYLEVMDDRGNMTVEGVSFEVRAGEVLGVAGVQGNGQTELVQALTGLRRPVAGRATVRYRGHQRVSATGLAAGRGSRA